MQVHCLPVERPVRTKQRAVEAPAPVRLLELPFARAPARAQPAVERLHGGGRAVPHVALACPFGRAEAAEPARGHNVGCEVGTLHPTIRVEPCRAVGGQPVHEEGAGRLRLTPLAPAAVEHHLG
eukprot:scaffold154539_cov24-Tisochrysis_lutea.AAC.3